MAEQKVGLGFDVHLFSSREKPLILGGCRIMTDCGLEAVSDGDVLLHALSDALCGACGLGDIGDYFPPDDENNRGIDSRQILGYIREKMNGRFILNNVDITLISDRPRLVPFKPEITESLRELLSIDAVNVKIKSKEGLDILGGKNAMSCLAVVLVSVL